MGCCGKESFWEGELRMKRAIFTACLVLVAMCLTSFADVIYLKSGGQLKGKVKCYEDNKFVIELDSGGQMSISMDQVQSIKFECGENQQPKKMITKIKKKANSKKLLSAEETAKRLDELVTVSWVTRSTLTGATTREGKDDFSWYLERNRIADSSEYMRLCEKLTELKKLKVIAHRNYHKAISSYIKAAECLKKIKTTKSYLYVGERRLYRKVPAGRLGNPKIEARKSARKYNEGVKEYNFKVDGANNLYERFSRDLKKAHEYRAEAG